MTPLPEPLKRALSDFILDLHGGLIEHDSWEWRVEDCDWERYKLALADPTILRTTLAVFLNRLPLESQDREADEDEAAFRAFQYFRHMWDSAYRESKDCPKFEPWEIAEP